MKLDFFARQAYYLDHLAPIWKAFPPSIRGEFWATDAVAEYGNRALPDVKFRAYLEENDCGSGPILTCAYGDAYRAVEWDKRRPVILMEHGVGLTFGKPAYADGLGARIDMALFPVPNRHTQDKVHPELISKPHPIVGMPKLDGWAGAFNKRPAMPERPLVVIAFHHGSSMSRPAETGSAREHYIDYLPELASRYNLAVHDHPLNQGMREFCLNNGILFLPDFNDVMQAADIYINDCSSTLYEFMVTGKPVIIMNAPWFDKINPVYRGIRFWEYADVGPQVEDPQALPMAIDRTIKDPDEFRSLRSMAVSDLFPLLGKSTAKTVDVIQDFLQLRPGPPAKLAPKFPTKKIKVSGERGILYMCWGAPAAEQLAKSIESLRSVGCALPVAVVGELRPYLKDGAIDGVSKLIEWPGVDPYDRSMAENFQFRAGRVKPRLYDLSPFKETMYVDVDTEFARDPEVGFNFLENWDFAVAQERLAINQLYNRARAGWEHNIKERDSTIEAFGGNGDIPFWNSGVLLWRRNDSVRNLFSLWADEWCRWEQWDEQLSLMRAANRVRVKVLVLSEVWNYPHRDNPGAVIYHEYGLGKARHNVNE